MGRIFLIAVAIILLWYAQYLAQSICHDVKAIVAYVASLCSLAMACVFILAALVVQLQERPRRRRFWSL